MVVDWRYTLLEWHYNIYWRKIMIQQSLILNKMVVLLKFDGNVHSVIYCSRWQGQTRLLRFYVLGTQVTISVKFDLANM